MNRSSEKERERERIPIGECSSVCEVDDDDDDAHEKSHSNRTTSSFLASSFFNGFKTSKENILAIMA